ncbi:DUF5810 domain-containing protein [Halomarina pelagica]|uniref:DUF5810 domain-containing protein n=1 Tax=Halomarina pelagica TaxID=2961599 RepID=UPI0020C5284D|nr:DUF5810 domain-containing protein [Halomarina sp. BND7]
MGYACPVCATPQSDARHLANHLAFTALIRGGDHEAWLDEHVPGWSERGETELAERVVGFADEEEFPQVFEDTTGGDDEHQHDHERSGRLFEDETPPGGFAEGRAPDRGRRMPGGARSPARDAETRTVLEKARELTERMRRDEADEGGERDENA